MVAPELLFGKKFIAEYFRVSARKVQEWYDDGAPIAFDGERYSVEVNALQNWIVIKTKKIS